MEDSIREQLRDPVFKGCTRPAMALGVPMVPLIIVGGACLLFAMWGLLVSPLLAFGSLVLAVVLVLLMRQITRHDDQRLRQWQLRAELRLGHRTTRFWGVTSYCANSYERR
ncbi:type IV secretion system protein VirB3 [Trinickia acidisoli]|uniref:type IV secretion system protein VirB3 n=1 Tax=Trinickia acidisoli TaxID=2767482 RepID=UPI001A8FF9DA|nr:VirB3 family type IV secretion system protein [Trinickia acidisoli]